MPALSLNSRTQTCPRGTAVACGVQRRQPSAAATLPWHHGFHARLLAEALGLVPTEG